MVDSRQLKLNHYRRIISAPSKPNKMSDNLGTFLLVVVLLSSLTVDCDAASWPIERPHASNKQQVGDAISNSARFRPSGFASGGWRKPGFFPEQQSDGRMFVAEKRSGRLVPLVPGLLDETLLNRGSFSFGAKRVKFNKLKVLGNVYVNRVNGHPLRETYLFKSAVNRSV